MIPKNSSWTRHLEDDRANNGLLKSSFPDFNHEFNLMNLHGWSSNWMDRPAFQLKWEIWNFALLQFFQAFFWKNPQLENMI